MHVASLRRPGSADPVHTPGGPCIQENQKVSRSSVASYDETVRTLEQIERSSGGRVTVASAGHSGERRGLLYATVGTGHGVSTWEQEPYAGRGTCGDF